MKRNAPQKGDVEKVIKRVELFLDRRECQDRGAGVRAANTVLRCLLDELELDLENEDLKKSSEHIYKIKRLMENRLKVGWSFDPVLIRHYKKLLKLYDESK